MAQSKGNKGYYRREASVIALIYYYYDVLLHILSSQSFILSPLSTTGLGWVGSSGCKGLQNSGGAG